MSDRFVWKWSSDGKYSASSAYRAFFVGATSLLGAKELWKVKAPPQVKFFSWLALHRRLWTAERRKQHGLHEADDCALCNQGNETSDHLFLGCVVARELWFKSLHPVGLDALVPAANAKLDDWWLRERLRIASDARPTFDTLVLPVSWSL